MLSYTFEKYRVPLANNPDSGVAYFFSLHKNPSLKLSKYSLELKIAFCESMSLF